MKNLKYISLFEAFESNLLSNTFKMVNPSEKNKFKSVLENICGKLNFPMSSLSDDLFIYEDTFNRALRLTVSDEACDNESDTIPGEKCSGKTDDEGLTNMYLDLSSSVIGAVAHAFSILYLVNRRL